MAGNRSRQSAFKIPLLIELAILGGEIDARRSGRDKSEDVADVIKWVLSYFSFSPALRRERHAQSGQLVLENDVRWTAKQLEDAGYLTRIKNEKWAITDSGLEFLRKYVATLVRKGVSDDELDHLMMKRNYNDEELLLQSLKIIAEASVNLPNYSLEATVIAGDSLRHVFRNAVANLPLREVGNLILYGYEPLKPFVSRDLADRYGLIAA